jgi:hypothetical protein
MKFQCITQGWHAVKFDLKRDGRTWPASLWSHQRLWTLHIEEVIFVEFKGTRGDKNVARECTSLREGTD